MHRSLKVGFAAVCGLSALLLCMLDVSVASAQVPGPPPFSDVTPLPTTSPYLNLFNNNGSANGNNANYQNFVRPALESRNNYYNQQSQINNLQRQISAGRPNGSPPVDAGRIRATGSNPSQYMNLSHYYQGSPAYRVRQ